MSSLWDYCISIQPPTSNPILIIFPWILPLQSGFLLVRSHILHLYIGGSHCVNLSPFLLFTFFNICCICTLVFHVFLQVFSWLHQGRWPRIVASHSLLHINIDMCIFFFLYSSRVVPCLDLGSILVSFSSMLNPIFPLYYM